MPTQSSKEFISKDAENGKNFLIYLKVKTAFRCPVKWQLSTKHAKIKRIGDVNN